MKMKKINKKGFTLIELLVVIVILVVIMAVAIPSVTSSIERSKDKQLTQVKNLVTSAAELYYDSHKNTPSLFEGNKITIKTLIEAGYLKEAEAKDPFHEKRTVCGYVEIGTSGQLKTYTFKEQNNCGSECKDENEGKGKGYCKAMTS